ncbi:L-threonylcarbamoyladenylate synthase [Myxococcota bacterium]|nr:L-threonylcarbamoyladenylate synthase [Myxococcota bacterium]
MEVNREDRLSEALSALRSDRLVAFPTETVWGLAACARSPKALDRLRRWKGRGVDHPISVLISEASVLESLGVDLGPVAWRLAERFWPGPLTLVLASRSPFAPGVARSDGAVGVRCSPHPLAAALVRAAEAEGLGPLTATSLNRTGEAPAQNREMARRLCDPAESPYLLEGAGEDASAGPPSTVLDLTCRPARLLRVGHIGLADLTSLGIEVDSSSAPSR